MTTELRKTGIDFIGDVPWGTHLCHFYETKDDLLDILIPYFKTGLEKNEFCMWVVFPPRIEGEAIDALRGTLPDIDRHLAAGDIEILPHTRWYLKDGIFDPQRVSDGWEEKLNQALSRGYDGMRVNGNEAWLTEKDWNDFSQYEKKLNELIANRRMIVLCTYPLAATTAAEFLDVASTHEFAIARRQGNWEVLETPEQKQAKAELTRLNEELERRVAERTRELAATNEELESKIIESKRAEEALRESAATLAEAQRVAKIGNWCFNLRTNKVTWSDELYRIFGIEKPDFDGRFESFVSRIHPDDQTLVLQTNAQTRIDGSPFDLEYRITTPDGQVKIIREVGYANQDDAGNVIRLFGTAQDITERKQLEKTLRESEGKYRLVVENAQEAIIIAQDGMLRFVNHKTLELLAYSEDEFLSKPMTEFIHPDDREMVFDKHLRRLTAEQLPARYSFRLLDKDGTVKWVEIGSALVSWEGRPAALIFMTDITERVRMEEALKESEEQYRTLVEESFDGILVQKASKIVFANRRLYEMLGYAQGELEGLDYWLLCHPDYQEIVRERSEARMRGEERPRQHEVVFQRKDGSYFEGEINVKVIDITGETGIQVWVRDISERKRSEEAQKRLATAVEQAAEGVVVTDVNGVIQYVNPAFERISGYAREELRGQNARLLKSGEHGQEFYRNLWDTIARGDVWNGRIINKKKDGRLYHEELTISPVRDDTGKIVNFVAVKRDITEHLQLSAQLLQAQKMEAIGTLAGGIAHDFNNLLQVTLGYSELLLAEKREDDPEYADLQKILRAAKSGAELVKSLLTFSRKVETKSIPLNLNRQVIQVEKLLRRTIPKMIEIELDLSDDLAEVSADPTQVEQILMNLAVNALDAMPDRGRLTVITRNATLDEDYCKVHVGAKPGEHVMLSVSDTGHGIGKEAIEHIFEPFYTTKEMGRGTGLGLAMVYGIVKQHGGHITCYSEVGHGTTFNVYFPAIEGQVEPEVDKTGVMPAFGTETILLVDDEELVRDLGARILSKAGYNVLTATNGKEALDLFEKERTQIFLVILDLIMPEMGGKECLKELRKIDPQLKVLIASGLSADPSMRESSELAAKGFVSKPFRMKELLRQVRRVLDES